MVEHLLRLQPDLGQFSESFCSQDGVKVAKQLLTRALWYFSFLVLCPSPEKFPGPRPHSFRFLVHVLGGSSVLASPLLPTDGDPGQHHAHKGSTGISVRTEDCASK